MAGTRTLRRSRSVGTASLILIATLGVFVVGVDGQVPLIRLVAAGIAVLAGAASLWLTRKRSGLSSWYAITIAVVLLRLASGA
ncbi:hypothetical protein [Curtobacterium aurantiacum]|uniref:hypothetical protein n=1 Tax=Curtobacterium aurantiacum TaxID=3236919 RepID=UPI001BDF9550|nr:hypothetical protein [Curtobacterium flaccumfaciens]MBT1675388.1 hypothetical protein [Curtobacterium flaccumfaciens pv. flaccumfaciens]